MVTLLEDVKGIIISYIDLRDKVISIVQSQVFDQYAYLRLNLDDTEHCEVSLQIRQPGIYLMDSVSDVSSILSLINRSCTVSITIREKSSSWKGIELSDSELSRILILGSLERFMLDNFESELDSTTILRLLEYVELSRIINDDEFPYETT